MALGISDEYDIILNEQVPIFMSSQHKAFGASTASKILPIQYLWTLNYEKTILTSK